MIKPDEVILVLGMAMVTFGVRYPLLALAGRIQFPPPLVRALKYVPPAVLTAIIVPSVFLPDDSLRLAPTSPYLIGGAVATLISWRTKNLLLTIVLGMAAFWGARALFGP